MFHRVKSEEIQNDPQDGSQNEQRDQQEVEGFAGDSRAAGSDTRIVTEQRQPEESKAAPQENTPKENTPTFNQKKESDSMNAQAEDNNTGIEREDKQAEQTRARSFENYQRQPSRSATGGYPGAYPGSSYAAPAAASVERDQSSDRTLTIGAGITMSGEIESCDQLVVEGTIEASLKGAHILDVTETGTFYGTVEIDEAVIAGRFEGDLTVNGRLVIRQSGTITGTIAYRELEVEAGAVLEGKMTPLKPVQQTEAAPKPRIKEAPKAESKEQTPANTDGHGLFSDKAVAAE